MEMEETEDRILGLTQLFIFLGGTLALLLSLIHRPTACFSARISGDCFQHSDATSLRYAYYKRATRTAHGRHL